MSGSAADLPAELERYRAYLGLIARLQVGRHLQAKVDLSGVVQQTLWEACQQMRQSPCHANELTVWLRKLLANNLIDELRNAYAKKRDVRRELSLEAALDESSARLDRLLAVDESSQGDSLSRQEQLVRLATALERLPDGQRQAIELHYLLGLPLADLAQRMERSKPSVAGLLQRGLSALRKLMAVQN